MSGLGEPVPCPVCGDDTHRSEGIHPACALATSTHDPVNHPKHYTNHPSGVECIQITEHLSFCVGNAIKYLWRADQKGSPIQDLEKARWYIDREITRRRAMK